MSSCKTCFFDFMNLYLILYLPQFLFLLDLVDFVALFARIILLGKRLKPGLDHREFHRYVMHQHQFVFLSLYVGKRLLKKNNIPFLHVCIMINKYSRSCIFSICAKDSNKISHFFRNFSPFLPLHYIFILLTELTVQ